MFAPARANHPKADNRRQNHRVGCPVRVSAYGSHAQLKAHVYALLMAYNFTKRLKALRASRRTSTSAKSGRRSQIGLG